MSSGVWCLSSLKSENGAHAPNTLLWKCTCPEDELCIKLPCFEQARFMNVFYVNFMGLACVCVRQHS